MNNQRISLEVTIQTTLKPNGADGDVQVLDWQLNVNPPAEFEALPLEVRAAFWRKLRDEIEENWMSAALGSDPKAVWNWRLEELDLG